MTTDKTAWTAAECWPDFTEAMLALGITMTMSDERIAEIAATEAPKAAAALGVETDADEFAGAMRAWRDERYADYAEEMSREHGPYGEH